MMDPICPVENLLNQKIQEMGILSDDYDADTVGKNEWLESNLVELMKNRVLTSMRRCTSVNKHKGQGSVYHHGPSFMVYHENTGKYPLIRTTYKIE